jgi:monothiol glutaredoxin
VLFLRYVPNSSHARSNIIARKRTDNLQAFRAATRATSARAAPTARFLTPFQIRCLSDEVRSAIDKAVASSPVVLFMKGTPETPQCGFSRASIQILGMQGVDPDKFTAFNVLEDQDLRAGL